MTNCIQTLHSSILAFLFTFFESKALFKCRYICRAFYNTLQFPMAWRNASVHLLKDFFTLHPSCHDLYLRSLTQTHIMHLRRFSNQSLDTFYVIFRQCCHLRELTITCLDHDSSQASTFFDIKYVLDYHLPSLTSLTCDSFGVFPTVSVNKSNPILVEFCYSGSCMTNDQLIYILNIFPNLTNLNTGGNSKITNYGINELVKKLPKLKQLHFLYSQTIIDSSIEMLSEIKTLEHLRLQHCPSIQIAGYRFLTKIQNLTTLSISSSNSIAIVEILTYLTNYDSLRITDLSLLVRNCPEQIIQLLVNLKHNLCRLRLEFFTRSSFPIKTLELLAQFTKLKQLRLCYLHLREFHALSVFINSIAKLSALQSLDIGSFWCPGYDSIDLRELLIKSKYVEKKNSMLNDLVIVKQRYIL